MKTHYPDYSEFLSAAVSNTVRQETLGQEEPAMVKRSQTDVEILRIEVSGGGERVHGWRDFPQNADESWPVRIWSGPQGEGTCPEDSDQRREAAERQMTGHPLPSIPDSCAARLDPEEREREREIGERKRERERERVQWSSAAPSPGTPILRSEDEKRSLHYQLETTPPTSPLFPPRRFPLPPSQ
ncbi:unnamed protein product [Leuciscus chuanchicus]